MITKTLTVWCSRIIPDPDMPEGMTCPSWEYVEAQTKVTAVNEIRAKGWKFSKYPPLKGFTCPDCQKRSDIIK
jgi:hypothetical protein